MYTLSNTQVYTTTRAQLLEEIMEKLCADTKMRNRLIVFCMMVWTANRLLQRTI